MGSQEDLFATQEPLFATQDPLFATQERKKKVKYDFLVLCDKDDKSPNPFSLYPTSMFSTKEIHLRWLESVLDDSSRLRSLTTLEGLGEKNLSLFGKIDEGIQLRACVHPFFSFINFHCNLQELQNTSVTMS